MKIEGLQNYTALNFNVIDKTLLQTGIPVHFLYSIFFPFKRVQLLTVYAYKCTETEQYYFSSG
jgi:hypothetical protein